MAEALGLEALTSELRPKIDHAARGYIFMAEFDDFRATRKQRRNVLERLAADADGLKGTMADISLMLIEEDLKLPQSITPDHLDQLAKAARHAAARVPLTGGDPAVARFCFVRDLGHIYKEATKKRPTLLRTKHHEPHGPFYEFVEAALTPLNKHATQGLEKDVRRVVREMRKLDTESPPK
jgi:hypothetical protein